MSVGNGITDGECETLIRWLWKFEGLAWNSYHAHDIDRKYSGRYTLTERVTNANSLDGVRGDLVFATALAHKNDPVTAIGRWGSAAGWQIPMLYLCLLYS